jgi:hypothetical protein
VSRSLALVIAQPGSEGAPSITPEAKAWLTALQREAARTMLLDALTILFWLAGSLPLG